MKQDKALKPEDGAIFCFDIEDFGADGFRASCGAVAEDGGEYLEEIPLTEMFETRAEAQLWVAKIGAGRGFETFHRRPRRQAHKQ